MDDWRDLGSVEVDSGTLVLGDPVYLLPHSGSGRPGLDAQPLLSARERHPALPIAGHLALLLAEFGGDGRFPVRGRFVGRELVSVRIDFEEPDA